MSWQNTNTHSSFVHGVCHSITKQPLCCLGYDAITLTHLGLQRFDRDGMRGHRLVQNQYTFLHFVKKISDLSTLFRIRESIFAARPLLEYFGI